MSRKDKQQNQGNRRVTEDLGKAFLRRDAVLAAETLLQLPASDRGEYLPLLVPLVAGEIDKAKALADQSKLRAWAVRATAELRLLGPMPDGERTWSLAWAALMSSDWSRGCQLLDLAVPEWRTAEDSWNRSLRLWVEARGEPSTDQFAELLPVTLAESLARTQTAKLEPDAPVARPMTSASVVRQVLAASLLPWPRFAETVLAWTRDGHDLVDEIAAVAARVAVREALQRHTAKLPRWPEPLEWLAELSEAISPLLVSQDLVTIALRLVAMARVDTFDVSEPPPRHLAAALRLVAPQPDLSSAALGLFAADQKKLLDGRGVSAGWVRLIELLCATTAEPKVVWFALRQMPLVAAQEFTCPAMVGAAQRALAASPNKLALAALVGGDLEDNISELISFCFPVDVAADILDAVWAVAGERGRLSVGKAALWLCERASIQWPDQLAGADSRLLMLATVDARHRLCRSNGADAEESQELLEYFASFYQSLARAGDHLKRNRPLAQGGAISAQGLGIWHRFKDRLVPLDLSYVEVALQVSPAPEEAHRVVQSFARVHVTPQDIQDLMRVVLAHSSLPSTEARQLIDAARSETAAGAAEVFLDAVDLRSDPGVLLDLGKLFLERLASHVGERTVAMAEAERLALTLHQSTAFPQDQP